MLRKPVRDRPLITTGVEYASLSADNFASSFPFFFFFSSFLDIFLSVLSAGTHRATPRNTREYTRNPLMQSEKYAARRRVGGEIMHFSFHRM